MDYLKFESTQLLKSAFIPEDGVRRLGFRANPTVIALILATQYISGPAGVDEVLPVMSFLLIMRLDVVVKVPGGTRKNRRDTWG